MVSPSTTSTTTAAVAAFWGPAANSGWADGDGVAAGSLGTSGTLPHAVSTTARRAGTALFTVFPSLARMTGRYFRTPMVTVSLTVQTMADE
jgi:hypothetical protein